MSDIADSDFNRLKREIMKRHLEQLQKLDVPVSTNPRQEEDSVPLSYDELVAWTNASRAQIDKGISNKVYGGPFGSEIDFNNAFMAFMESAAVYLRDDSQVLKAVNVYRSNKNSDEAFRLLESSVSDIYKLADMWGMHFIQICDFVTLHPDGQSFMVGPFCGAFIPKDYSTSDKPFIGVTFKGTGVPGEDLNDILAVSPTSSPDWLWGSRVGAGFFYPLFSSYEQYASLRPFDLIQQAIRYYANDCKATMTNHVTGHSLGGAYATLTYAELCIKGVDTPKAIIGDLYAFAAPRVGLEDFAIPVRDAVHSGDICKGSSWRIVNNDDPVTDLPLIPLPPVASDRFIHIDAAYGIYADKTPEPKPSEIGTTPEWSLTTAFSFHNPREYYKSLVYTTTGKPPITDGAMQWGGLSVAHIPKGISFPKQVEVKCSFASNHGHIIGIITYESFVGEITAPGSFTTPEMGGKAYIYLNSWEDLYRGRNKCVFERTSDSSLALTLSTLGNDTPVAFVDLPISSQYTGEVNLTAGTCNWRFNRTDKVIAVEKSLKEACARIFAELFAA